MVRIQIKVDILSANLIWQRLTGDDKSSFRYTINVKQFGPRPGPTFLNVGPDLGSNCLQSYSADDKSWNWQVALNMMNCIGIFL